MRRKGSSQEDVARLAGVSPTAVSIVLNGKESLHRIAPDTVLRIHRAMTELKYRPNAVAQALVHGRTNTIGVVLGEADMTYLTNAYYGPVLQGIIGYAFAQRRYVLLYHGGELGEDAMHAASYADGRCDGLILTAPSSGWRLITDPLIQTEFPFVTLGDMDDDPNVAAVDVDNIAAAEQATDYLFDHGHRRILALAMSGYSASTLRRLVGCRRATERRGGTYAEQILDLREDGDVLNALRPYLDRDESKRPTALFCLTDQIALQAMRLLREVGLEIPRDLSVVGFDDIPAAKDANLTTVRQDPVLVGKCATRLLLQLVGSRHPSDLPPKDRKILVPTVFVERLSVTSPPV